MSIVVILQARVTSSRLPGKVLKSICGKPMLQLQIERVQRALRPSRLVVATSLDSSDHGIASLCDSLGVDCFRGSLNDVLGRFSAAAEAYSPAHIVRVTGDCPLIDPQIIDEIIEAHLSSSADYTSNTLEPTFPDGLDVEVMRSAALARAATEVVLQSEREHVTPYIYKHAERFLLHSVRQAVDRSAMRWVVDEPADFDFVTQIYAALYHQKPTFSTNDILSLLHDNPMLPMINSGFSRNEGYERSLVRDASTGLKPLG